ncbi:MAG: tetraacyldisaccharide 4'-kinase [Deltaproteobacteria bacterium]|nr:tetraacyldisaccharide 4'-kinase [Deltaproteobacteria bacterium]
MPPVTPLRLWYDDAPSPSLRVARAALAPLSAAWWIARTVHRGAYGAGLLHAHRCPARVVGVGNVVTGGAGKTPVVLALAEHARARGLAVAVVSRGYGVALPPGGARVSNSQSVLLDAAHAGDEPAQLARALPGVSVYAGRDRAMLADRAAREAGAAVVLLDDALQHHRVHQDARVAVLRVPGPFGNGRLLPAGPLRDPASVLADVDAVVLLGDASAATDQPVPDGVRPARVLRAALVPARLVRLSGPETPGDPAWLRGRRVLVAAAVARPDAVARTVGALGAVIAATWARPDHAGWTAGDVAQLEARVRAVGAEAAVVTEKDAAGWPLDAREPPVVALQVRVRWLSPGAAGCLDALLGAGGERG